MALDEPFAYSLSANSRGDVVVEVRQQASRLRLCTRGGVALLSSLPLLNQDDPSIGEATFRQVFASIEAMALAQGMTRISATHRRHGMTTPRTTVRGREHAIDRAVRRWEGRGRAMDLLGRLRGEVDICDGELTASDVRLRWSAAGIEITEGGQVQCLGEGAWTSVQLSGSRRAGQASWFGRLLGRGVPWDAVIHAELRSNASLRLRLDAVLPSRDILAALPRLEVHNGMAVAFTDLADLLETVVALGAQLVEVRSIKLENAAALARTRLEGIYEVERQLVHIPFAEVAEISAIEVHDNADRLEIARVAGLSFVVRKGTRRVGDRVVYLPVGTKLPKHVASALKIERYLRKGKFVRDVTLRGVTSQGLLLDLERDQDVLTKLGAITLGKRTRVRQVIPHPKLRDFDIVCLDGAQCVARKGAWGDGDRVIFLHAGVALPATVITELDLGAYLDFRGRIAVKKFKGEVSHGLLVADHL